MFRIDAPIDEGRSEPLFRPGSAVAGLPPLSASRSPLAVDSDRREPTMPPVLAEASGSAAILESTRPVASERRQRPFGPVGSLILHLLPLLLLLEWPMHPPAPVTPIPVRLVFQPPPPPPRPKPVLKQRLRPERRPPRGRLASESMGDTHAKGPDQAKSRPPAMKAPPTTGESPFEVPQQTAFLPPPPQLPTPPEITLPKPPEPKKPVASKPARKPAMPTRQLVRRFAGWARLDPRPARFPGPAATRDEYLAYLAYLARRHLGLLTHSLIGDRRGETVIDVLVLDDGTVALLSVGQSSGYPDIDARVEDVIRAVGRFPPLPQWFQGSRMQLEFRLEFPEALDD